MDFAYFQLFRNTLKAKGLKAQVIFVHKEFQFEVWVSGYNRRIQGEYYKYLKHQTIKYSVNNSPSSVDYIFKSSLLKDIDMSDGALLVELLKTEIREIAAFAESIDLS